MTDLINIWHTWACALKCPKPTMEVSGLSFHNKGTFEIRHFLMTFLLESFFLSLKMTILSYQKCFESFFSIFKNVSHFLVSSVALLIALCIDVWVCTCVHYDCRREWIYHRDFLGNALYANYKTLNWHNYVIPQINYSLTTIELANYYY